MDFDADLDAPPEWVDAPVWLDLVDEADVIDCPAQLAAVNELGPMSVAETLLAASLVGPGPEAIRLLTSLRGQELTGEQQLTAVELWQPQLAWVTGAEQTAIIGRLAYSAASGAYSS